ncbi:hypothetical protein PROFUN_11447 [Planoprotostelium fungivorum]|uniref:NmrA-like domain-containing protein n=1 Tax=Planoprotostelium fungivorum TaxID=1890364 RepID=A0A2P6N4W0_9EUKA|nr:hypothetical protein PROFUN_11447 [Planoprotostelium fungivorum]
MSLTKVGVIGGRGNICSGNLGREIVRALLDNKHFKEVYVFTRSDTVAKGQKSDLLKEFESKGAKIHEIDYTDEKQLKEGFTLLNGGIIISLAPSFAPADIDTQKKHIDTAVQCGVKRWVPNEFGTAPAHPPISAFQDARIKIKDHLETVKDVMSHTFFFVGYFNEFITQRSGFGFSLEDKTADLEAGGEQYVSWTTRPDIGRFVASALSHPKSENAEVRVCGDVKRMIDVVHLFERELGTTFTLHKYSVEESRQRYKEKKCSVFALTCAEDKAYVGRSPFSREEDLKKVSGLDNEWCQDFAQRTIEDNVKEKAEEMKKASL